MAGTKDLTEALRQLTEQAQPAETQAPPRGSAARVVSAAVPSGGVAKGGATFAPGGAQTFTSTDGLFTLSFPETLVTTLGDSELTIGVIKKVP